MILHQRGAAILTPHPLVSVVVVVLLLRTGGGTGCSVDTPVVVLHFFETPTATTSACVGCLVGSRAYVEVVGLSLFFYCSSA